MAMIAMYLALLAVMIVVDIAWTVSVWPDADGAYELMSGLIPIATLTLLVTLAMINIPFASVVGVMAGSVLGFSAFAVFDARRAYIKMKSPL